MSRKVLVACIGNIFLGDDGFGVEMASRLTQRKLADGVSVVDFGIRSYDLAYAMMQEWDLVILVDALPRGGEPGTLYLLEPEPTAGEVSPSVDAHTMNPASVLQLVGALGGKVGRLLVIGCEPASVEPDADGNIGLSAAVSGALDDAVRMIDDVITRELSQIPAA